MKKGKTKVWIATMLAAAMLGGCGGGNSSNSDSTEAQSQVGEKYTVTFYDSDGKTVLDTKEVKAGECVEEFEPEKGDSTFVGWYATPQMNHRFDFSTKITSDTSVFGGFVSYQEDTRRWAIVGSGSSQALLESNWGKVINDAQTLKKEDINH